MAIDSERFNKWANSQTDVAINRYERRFYRHINSLSDDIEQYLSGIKTIDDKSKPEIDSIIAQLVSIQDTRYAEAVTDFLDDAALLARYAAYTEQIGLGLPDLVGGVYAKVVLQPVSASGELLPDHMATLVAYNNERLAKTVRYAWSNKTAVDELVTIIVGTKRLRFTDGLIHKQKLSARAAIDTACHHVAQTARAEERAANGVYKYRIVATLDGRTTSICRGLDGDVYTYGAPDARVPPFHYFCRTVIVPEIDASYAFLSEGRTRASPYGSIDANINYSQWARDNEA